jgi:hypothetical protein
MTTEANFPLQQLCLKPSLYGRFSLDHLWPLLGDHRGQPVPVLANLWKWQVRLNCGFDGKPLTPKEFG